MIQDSINRISYDGNGIATEFAYPFTIITISDIKVMIVDTDGTETVLTNDYYVDEVNSKVDYPGYPEGEEPLPENQPPILATGQKIVIYRELSVTQLTSLFDQYPFKTIEAMIDKTTILLQQLKDAQERALTLSVSTDTAVSLILPAPSALKSFRWNASANKLELTADPATVLASVQGYTEQAEGYATSANEDAETATTGANTATSQAAIAVAAAELFTLATQAEAEAGTNAVHIMTPLRVEQQVTKKLSEREQAIIATTPEDLDNSKKVANTEWIRSRIASLVSGCIASVATQAGFAAVAAVNGYIKLPSWLGNIVLQWGFINTNTGTISFPIPFPSNCWNVLMQRQTVEHNDWTSNVSAWNVSNFTWNRSNYEGGYNTDATTSHQFYIAIGN